MSKYKPCAMCDKLTFYTRLHKRPYENKSEVCADCFNELVKMEERHRQQKSRRTSDSFYAGYVVLDNGDMFWKQGKTCEDSMQKRYSGNVYKYVYPVLFYNIGEDNTDTFEREMIKEMPVAASGNEWYYAGSGELWMSKIHEKLEEFGVVLDKEKDYLRFSRYFT